MPKLPPPDDPPPIASVLTGNPGRPRRFGQLQKESDALRLTRETLTSDAAALRQQIQSLKDQLASSDKQAAEFMARQSAT